MTIIVVFVIIYLIDDLFFPQFINSYTLTVLIAITGFVCGLICGETLKSSIINVIILGESLIIILFSIMFAFNLGEMQLTFV